MARDVDPEAHYALAAKRLALDRGEDAAASQRLASLLRNRFVLAPDRLRYRFEGQAVVVLGAGRCDVDAVARASRTSPVVVAGSAIGPAFTAKVRPALCVSDLDGDAEAHVAFSREGVPLAVHAHGDNVALLEALVPRLEGPLVGTCQTRPPERPVPLHRFGGFTDGDRACFLAAALGARRVLLAGFAFDDASVDEPKRSKLDLARELLDDLPVPASPWES